MSADTRNLIHESMNAERHLARAMAHISIAAAAANLAQAKFVCLAPSHWPVGSPQRTEEAEDRHYAVSCAREELAIAKSKLAQLEKGE